MRDVYLTDGSPVCFFTAVFDAYADKNALISPVAALQTELGDRFIAVAPDEEKARRVVKKLGASDGLYEIDCILRTPDSDREQTALEYIRLLIRRGASVRGMLTDPVVRRARELTDRVGTERHRLTGFLRFSETVHGIFYAACSPDNNVVDLLMPHFAARFKTAPFVIHDVSRALAGICDGNEWLVSPLSADDRAEIVFSENEDDFLALWKKYYRTVYIPVRKNTRQMKNYMPVRYWRFMPEKTD